MTLSRWQHAALSFFILLALLALIFAVIINPAIAYYQERHSELITQQERLQRYHEVARQKDTLIPYYKEQLSLEKENKNFLPVMASSVAAAKLQQQVKSLLADSQGQLISTQPVRVEPEGVFSPVMIRIHMKSDISSLLYVLHTLESSQPLAFIDNLQIQRIGGLRNNNRRNNKVNMNPLDTHFNLKVYMLKKSVSP